MERFLILQYYYCSRVLEVLVVSVAVASTEKPCSAKYLSITFFHSAGPRRNTKGPCLLRTTSASVARSQFNSFVQIDVINDFSCISRAHQAESSFYHLDCS